VKNPFEAKDEIHQLFSDFGGDDDRTYLNKLVEPLAYPRETFEILVIESRIEKDGEEKLGRKIGESGHLRGCTVDLVRYV
jgi:hypothetical protein